MSWRIVTNGKTYRLENYMEYSGRSYFYNEEYVFPGLPVPKNFCLDDAKTKLRQLEQEEKDNTWVPIE